MAMVPVSAAFAAPAGRYICTVCANSCQSRLSNAYALQLLMIMQLQLACTPSRELSENIQRRHFQLLLPNTPRAYMRANELLCKSLLITFFTAVVDAHCAPLDAGLLL